MKAYEWALSMRDGVSSVMSKLSSSADKTSSNFTGLQAKLDNVSHKLRNSDGAIDHYTGKFTSSFSHIKSTILGVLGAITVFDFGRDAVKGADEGAKLQGVMRAQLLATKGVAGQTLEGLAKQAKELSKTRLFDDDATMGAQSALLKFTNVRDQVFKSSIPVIQDVATAMKMDLSSAADLVGKSLNNPMMAFRALREAGISFTKGQMEGVEKMLKQGKLHEAQQMILLQLMNRFGGAAANAAQEGMGPVQLLMIEWEDFKKGIGAMIIDFVQKHTPEIRKFFEALKAGIQIVAEKFFMVIQWIEDNWKLVQVIGAVVGAVWLVHKAIQAWTAVQAILNVVMALNPIVLVVAAIAALVIAIYEAWQHCETFRAVVMGVWEVLKSFFSFIWEVVKRLPLVSLIVDIINHWDLFTAKIKSVYEVVKPIFEKIYDAAMFFLKPIIEAVKGVGSVLGWAADKLGITETFNKGADAAKQTFRREQFDQSSAEEKAKLISGAQQMGKKMGWDENTIKKYLVDKGYTNNEQFDKLKVESTVKKIGGEGAAKMKGSETVKKLTGDKNLADAFKPDFGNDESQKIDTKTKKGIDSITEGGKEQRIVTTNIAKLVEHLNINTTTIKEGATELKAQIEEALLRAIQGGEIALNAGS